MTHDVFISYSHKDKTVALAIVAGLEREGIRCWITPRVVMLGDTCGDAIITAIDEAQIMILVLSENANRSRQVLKEVECAKARDSIIIPFRIENINPTGALAYFLASEHWLYAFTKPFEEQIRELTRTIRLCRGDIDMPKPNLPSKIYRPKESQKPTLLGLFNIFKTKEQNKHEKRIKTLRPLEKNSPKKKIDKTTPYVPFPQVDNVNFSVTSPPITYPGSNYVIDVWAFLDEDRQKMIERAHEEASGNEIRVKSKGTFKLERGSVLAVQLEIADVSIDPEYDTI